MSLEATPQPERIGAEPRWRRRALALVMGLGCHGTFLVAVTLMFLGLHDGLQDGLATGLVRLTGPSRIGLDVLLALQFPLLHSTLLTRRGQRWLARGLGERHGWTLTPTTYAWIAALQILSTFLFWAPGGTVLWEARGGALVWMNALYGASWPATARPSVSTSDGCRTCFPGDARPPSGRGSLLAAVARHSAYADGGTNAVIPASDLPEFSGEGQRHGRFPRCARKAHSLLQAP